MTAPRPSSAPVRLEHALVSRLEAVTALLGQVAAFAIFALVLLVTTNVLLRYFFRTGSVWSQELEWHLMAPIALFAIPYTLMKGDAVRVDVLYERFSGRTRLLLDIFAGIVGMAVAFLLLKYSIPYVEKSWMNGEGSPDPGGLPARYLLKAILPIGFAALFCQQLAQVITNCARLSGTAYPADTDKSDP